MKKQPYLGLLLREQRIESHKTLRHAARHSGISHSHLQKIESGVVEPTLSTLLRIIENSEFKEQLECAIFEVEANINYTNEKLVEAMFERFLSDSQLPYWTPMDREKGPDFYLKFGEGREIAIEIKWSPTPLRQKK